MGKGDKKTRRGKIVIGSFGVRRPRNKSKKIIVVKDLGTKPKKPVEVQIINPVEEPVLAPIEIIEVPVAGELPQEITAPKKPARKAPVKKSPEKAEKPVKAEKDVEKVNKETTKTDKEPAKPKTPKPKKKPTEASKNTDEPVKE